MQLKPNTSLQGGKYKIIRTLGQGGFGITYLAEQVALHRKVAVKEFFMKDCCERDLATARVTVGTGSQRALVEKFRGKFIREAQMIAGLDHPHIVRVYDVFEERGTAYYVMAYLEGDSLADRIKRNGALPEGESLRFIRQVGSALSYLHGRNCLHFDVKPSNILVNKMGQAVLIDFGVSKHYDAAGGQTSSTPVGISKGYAPLEQYQQAEISTFTPATDIYALGATLYTLVTGLVPPSAPEVYEEGIGPMPDRISRTTREAIRMAMSPRRKDRPQSVGAFLDFLDEDGDENEYENESEPSISKESDATIAMSGGFSDMDSEKGHDHHADPEDDQNEETDRCWYCGKPVHSKEWNHEITMRREIGRDFHSIEYETIDLSVPRCKECFKTHSESFGKGCAISALVGAAIIVILFIIAEVADWDGFLSPGAMFAYGVIGLLLLGLVDRIKRNKAAKRVGIKKVEDLKGFAPYDYFKSQGWD